MVEPRFVDLVTIQEQLSEIIRSADAGGAWQDMRLQLASLRPFEIANLISATPPHVRQVIWSLVEEEDAPLVLQHLGEDVRAEILETMDPARLVAVADSLDTDDLADILQQLPQTIGSQLLASMDALDRERVEAVLSYPEDSAGGLMNTDTITVRPRHSIEVVLRYLRRRGALPQGTDALIVVNKQNEYVGVLPLSRLLTTDPSVTVREAMNTDVEAIPVTVRDTEVARMFAEQDLISAPVVDPANKVVGRITIDDVVDVIIDEADETVLARAGLDVEDDTFAPVMKSARRRAVWLGINLATALLAAAVINVFEATIAKVVALAILMPIVASMGGIAGTQTLTLVIRGQALGHIGRANLVWLLNREVIVAVLNGLLWAALVAAGTAIIFDDVKLGALIAAGLVVNMLVAAIFGSILPSLLAAMRIDPAIAGGVVLTTITDVAGFFVFLGLATLVYA
jgi:magnesium transporter